MAKPGDERARSPVAAISCSLPTRARREEVRNDVCLERSMREGKCGNENETCGGNGGGALSLPNDVALRLLQDR